MSVPSVPMQSVGRALARITSLRGTRAAAGAGGGDSRASVLAFIEAADDVVRVEDIADAVELHPNTVRGHLDALLAAGRITRIPDQRTSRGRPHWLYSATAAVAMRELGRALDDELSRASAPDVAHRAAAAWADAGPGVRPSETVEAAVDQAARSLADLGFEADRNLMGDEITLRSCPYAALVRDHPVICDIHAEVLGQVLARTGQPVTLTRLDVFPRPGMCVAHLHRPDADPLWSIEPAAPAQSATPAPTAPRARPGRRARPAPESAGNAEASENTDAPGSSETPATDPTPSRRKL